MNILAIITHEDPSFVGICLNGKVLEHRFERQKLVAEQLAEVSAALLKLENKTINDIEVVAVIVGPGSYTGIRVGMAFAKALVQFSERKLFAVSPFEVMRHTYTLSTPSSDEASESTPQEGNPEIPLLRGGTASVTGWIPISGAKIMPIINAGRGNVYVRENGIVSVKNFEEVKGKYDSQVLVGSGAVANGVEVAENLKFISVKNICDYVEFMSEKLKNYNSNFDTFVKLVPEYVQEARIG